MPSLTETAKAILMNEGSIPSVSASDSDAFRDAKSSNPNMATLKPGSKTVEGVKTNPGAPAASEFQKKQDLGPALTKNTDTPPSAKAAGAVSKDTSKSAKSSVSAEPPKKAKAEMMEEEIEADDSVMTEDTDDVELSEELIEFIDALTEQGLSEEEIAQAIEENFEIIEEEVELEEEEIEESSMDDYQVDMREHVDALLSGEELSEDFREKATTIFEAAVKAKLEEEMAIMEAAFAEILEEEIEAIKEELSSNVDDYLNYVVEQWVADNEVAIESGLRTELTEEFISGLRNLFAENYIDIPEEKVSVVEELSAKVEEVEAKLNEEIERNVALNRMLSESKKFETLTAMVEGLTATQAEKLKTLAEGVEFTTVDEFATKVKTIRENYFPSSGPNGSQALDIAEPDNDGKSMISESLQGPMAAYVKTLGRTLPK